MSQEVLVVNWEETSDFRQWFVNVHFEGRAVGWIGMAPEINKDLIDAVRKEAITRRCDAFIREKKTRHLKPIIIMGGGSSEAGGQVNFI